MGIGVNNRRFHHIALIWHITASVCGALLFDTSAMAQAAEGAKARDKVAPGQKKHAIKTKHAAGISAKTTPLAGKPVAVAEPAAAAPVSPARFDKTFGVKGWDIYFPSFGDTLTQDYGGWRSALAQTGFGFLEFNVSTFNLNMLSTPTKVPASSFVPSLGISSAYPYCSKTSGSICAGSQTYFGQRPAFFNGSFAYLTYDTSRWGVPDGQILLTGSLVGTTDEAYYPHVFQMSGLSWYQTLFDKKVELKFGYIANLQDFVGTFIGGNFANTFGVGASIPVELGLPDSPTTAPTARATIHLTGNVYDEFAIQRSLPAKGPTGNALVDETKLNPTGFTFSRAGEGLLYINELGYKNEAAPGVPQTWGRFGIMYNTSPPKD